MKILANVRTSVEQIEIVSGDDVVEHQIAEVRHRENRELATQRNENHLGDLRVQVRIQRAHPRERCGHQHRGGLQDNLVGRKIGGVFG